MGMAENDAHRFFKQLIAAVVSKCVALGSLTAYEFNILDK